MPDMPAVLEVGKSSRICFITHDQASKRLYLQRRNAKKACYVPLSLFQPSLHCLCCRRNARPIAFGLAYTQVEFMAPFETFYLK